MRIGESDWNGVCDTLNGPEMTGAKFFGAMSPGLPWIFTMAESECTGCQAKGMLHAAFPNMIFMAVAAS